MEKNLLKRAAWIEVDLQALRENFVNIKALLPAETQIVAVVKANAYGHGAVPVAQCLLAEGASRLAVAGRSVGVARGRYQCANHVAGFLQ